MDKNRHSIPVHISKNTEVIQKSINKKGKWISSGISAQRDITQRSKQMNSNSTQKYGGILENTINPISRAQKITHSILPF